MTESIFNLFELIFKYNGDNVSVIIDNEKKPWFSGAELANLLEYDNTSHAISNNVNEIDKKPFSDLKVFLDEIPKNSQPHAIYVNEVGFYCLIFGSKKKLAKEFKMWVFRIVLPSIRQFGYYQIEDKYKNKIADLNKKIKNKNSRIEVLENNQKKQKFPNGGLVYALEPMGMLQDDAQENSDNKLVRIGKSEHMQKRWNTYNTSVPDNFKLLYHVRVDNPIPVEYCIRSVLNEFIYRKNKDYYLCTMTDIIKCFDDCVKFIANRNISSTCDKCNKCNENDKTMESSKSLKKHLKNDHGIDLKNIQIGGNNNINENSHFYQKYIKYKTKYENLKVNIDKNKNIIDI